MLYVIDNKYYFKMGRKFVRVNVTYKNGDLQLDANPKEYIEDNGNIEYSTQNVDEAFKNKIKSSKSYKKPTFKEM